jgi:hypothetical protein
MPMINPRDLRDLHQRVQRIESKLVRGFEELGVNISTDDNWMTVDNDHKVVYIDSLGRSLMVIRSDMLRHGADRYGHAYDLVHRGDVVGTIMMEKK